MIENCFDYIFEIKPTGTPSQPSVEPKGTKVERMNVEKGAKRTWDGKEREYGQLSDHYGLSTTLQLL